MRSYGVADNFQYSLYDPDHRSLSPDVGARGGAGAHTGGRGASGLCPSPIRSSPSTAASFHSEGGDPEFPSIRSKPPRDKSIGYFNPPPVHLVAPTSSGSSVRGGCAVLCVCCVSVSMCACACTCECVCLCMFVRVSVFLRVRLRARVCVLSWWAVCVIVDAGGRQWPRSTVERRRSSLWID